MTYKLYALNDSTPILGVRAKLGVYLSYASAYSAIPDLPRTCPIFLTQTSHRYSIRQFLFRNHYQCEVNSLAGITHGVSWKNIMSLCQQKPIPPDDPER